MSNPDVIILSSDDEEPSPVVKEKRAAFTKLRKKEQLFESASSEDSDDVIIIESVPKRKRKPMPVPSSPKRNQISLNVRSPTFDCSGINDKIIPAFFKRSTSIFAYNKVRVDRQEELKKKIDRRKATLARLTAQQEEYKRKEAKKKEEEQKTKPEENKWKAAERESESESVASKKVHYKKHCSSRADLDHNDYPSQIQHWDPQRFVFQDARRMEQSNERRYVRPMSPRHEPRREQCHVGFHGSTPSYFITRVDDIVKDYISYKTADKSEEAIHSFYRHRDFPDNGPSTSERYHQEVRHRCLSPPPHHNRNYAPYRSASPSCMSPPISGDYRREQPFDSLPTRHNKIAKQEFVDEAHEKYWYHDNQNSNVSSWLLQNERVKAEAVDYDEDIGVDYPFPKAKRMRTEYIVVPPKKVAKPLNRDELGPPPDGIHFNFPKKKLPSERHPVLTSMADDVEKAFPYISKETNCEFEMGEKYPGCDWVWITVNGSPDDTLKAKYAINEWILKEQASVRPVFEVNWATGKIFVDIPLSIRGLIFGEKGMNIRNLERSSNVKIFDNRRGCFDKSPPLMIVGKIPYVRETYEKLKEIIEEAIEKEKKAFKVSLKVPSTAIGAIMGFKGENIRKLIQETHVRVELDTKNKEDRERTIDLYGEQSEIEAAMTAIQKHVDESGPCPQDEGVFHVSVPKREVGRLIGNKGERLRWIAERSSAKCHIVFDEHDDATAVCSGGLVEAEFARHLVQVILRVIDSEIPFQMTDLGNLSKVARHERKHLSNYYLNHPLNGQTYRSNNE